MTTMLELVQQATREMALPVPTYVAGNTQADVVQQLALLNAVGYEIYRQYDWQALNKSYLFTVEAITLTGTTTDGSSSMTAVSSIVGVDETYQISGLGINQATYVNSAAATTIVMSQPATSSNTGATYTLTKVKYAMPSDYDRQIDRTHWDKSKHWEMLGPETAQQWEWLISGYISTGPRVRYRIFGNYFQIWGTPDAGEVLGYEYCSKGWAATSAGVVKNSFTLDTDTCIFPDRLMVLGLKHKYWQLKGFGDTYRGDYEAELGVAKSNDAGSATLSFAPRPSGILITSANIPDSGYGQ